MVRQASRFSNADTAVRRLLDAPAGRPLALVGRSGSGKTTLLRAALGERRPAPLWLTAVGVVGDLISAIRSERAAEYEHSFAADPRPLVVEHLEDVRARERAQVELQRLFIDRARRRRAVLLTLTLGRGTDGVIEWLGRFADVHRLPRLVQATFSVGSPHASRHHGVDLAEAERARAERGRARAHSGALSPSAGVTVTRDWRR
jgi:hypothetical protein